MEMVRALQEANEKYRIEAKAEQEILMAKPKVEHERVIAKALAEQVLKQDQLMAEIDVSCANVEELHKTNKDLHKSLEQHEQRSAREQGLNTLLRAHPKPFSQAIMDELVPPHYIMPKIVFTRVEDPENHLTTFNAQMIISGGTNAIHCKMFMGTLTETIMQSFSGLPDGHITSFDQFSELFREQFSVNQAKPPILFLA